MSYQVLARKWRPRRFSELVGQEHVVRALSNALDTGRMHHAFLFTGTRGVGKTTIARIFAKSLNCEKGLSSDPCGACSACADIDAGRFVDLLEIDAASNTGVDDVREMIENAQYTPARGNYKVYLIDEVHMLSRNAFNALLKTLEEPPPHVKFLLATTDPQKLPVTVLSRCLKFNLRRLSPEQITGQLAQILTAEGITQADAEAVRELARVADGSLRDALSLLDQAIAYGAGAVRIDDVRAMLGTIERGQVFPLLEAIAAGDGGKLLAEVDRLAEFSLDFATILEELATCLHRIQLKQLVPEYAGVDPGFGAALEVFASTLTPQNVQLYYQMVILGRRDLALAPNARSGFEMTLLRLLAFRPMGSDIAIPVISSQTQVRNTTSLPKTKTSSASAAPQQAVAEPITPHQYGQESMAVAVSTTRPSMPLTTQPTDWAALVDVAGLRGPVGQLAQHSALLAWENDVLRLALKPAHEHLNTPTLVTQMEQLIGQAVGTTIKVRFEKMNDSLETPAELATRAKSAQQQRAETAISEDPVVQSLMQSLGARVVPNSIKPVESGS